VETYRERLVETAAEADEELLEKYFDKGELTEDELIRGIRAGVLVGRIFPVLCGDALRGIGIQAMLDAFIHYAPSPAERPAVVCHDPTTQQRVDVESDTEAPFLARVFKTISESHVGEMSLLRVYAGVLRSGMDVVNATREGAERVGQIYLLNGEERHEVGSVRAGDIGALVKMKDTHTGDTLCDRRRVIICPPIAFPDPVIRMAILPKSKGDEDKISQGLSRLHEEDPSFIAQYDPEIKQTIIAGQGELHLDVIIEKLKKKFAVDVNAIKPRIPYRETIRGSADGHHRHKKQTGGHGQFGEVRITIEPLLPGMGFEFVDAITGGAIPAKFIPPVEKGIVEAMKRGVLAGYPVIDVKVTLSDGSFHSVDSSDLSFQIAGSMAFQRAFMEAKPILLEPIYHIEVRVPEECMGDVIGDLTGRGGKILGMEADRHFQVVRAEVPLAKLDAEGVAYSTAIRSMTQGRGLHTRRFSHYEQVPHDRSEKVIAEAKKEQET
ncbi:MAG: elongation factor G, partial [Candidatus Latescibacteria bacterium]|nr:elongation factor G [Candidatus Latescibacterota bacterium]